MPQSNTQSPTLASLQDGTPFEGFYVIKESSFQTANNGKNYIRMTVADATANIMANVWDANRELFNLCPAGSIAKIQGITETYKGKTQIRINRFRPAHESEVDINQFLPKSIRDPEEMKSQFFTLIDAITDKDYHNLAQTFFDDHDTWERFARSPAARDIHHAFIGGLLEHTLNIGTMARAFAASGRLDGDLLLIGSLLHDIGKIDELEAKFTIDYTTKGKLLGHLAIGSEMTAQRAAAIPDFPGEKLALVQHMILSHHGKYEYGSPVLPKIPEAFALHHLDNLDAKVETANKLIDAVTDPEKHWTDFSRALETQLYTKRP